jgi:hypothetical protein
LIFNGERLSVGNHTARVTAADAAGNTADTTWTLKVVRK